MKQQWLLHSGINLVGAVLPILLAIIAIPLLLQHMGMERFGLLSLSWAITGYLSLLDFGLGRAMAQKTAAHHDNKPVVAQWFWDIHLITFSLGFLGTLLLLICTPFIGSFFPDTASDLNKDIQNMLWLTALLVLPSLLINSMSYFLMALSKFVALNLLKTPFNLTNIAIPVGLIFFPQFQQNSLMTDTLVYMLVSRWIFMVLFLLTCFRVYPALLKLHNWHFRWHKELFRLGGWMTISNLVGPIMTYFDRFFIASILSPLAVGTYSIAYEISSKLSIISGSVASSLAPHFATTDHEGRSSLGTIMTASQLLLLIFIPIVLLTYYFAEPVLQWWLQQDNVHTVARILNWLVLGMLFNAIALIAYTYLHFAGRPDITAKLHLMELPVYLVLLAVLLTQTGVVGAAIAWTIRSATDMLLMLTGAYRVNYLTLAGGKTTRKIPTIITNNKMGALQP